MQSVRGRSVSQIVGGTTLGDVMPGSGTARRLLCPVLWVSRKGLLLIMATARPLEPAEFDLYLYLDLVMRQWDPLPDEDGHPFEPKPSDWGRYHGRIVAVDYSTLADLSADRR
jgi:hypothetical protein